MMASVMPSAKYSSEGSLPELTKGRTSSEPAAARRSVAFERRDEAVAALGNGLDHLGLARVVAEHFAQFGDGAGQHVFGDEGAGPHGGEQLLLGDDFMRVLGEALEHLHNFGLHARGAAVPGDAVELRLNRPAADAKIAIHGNDGFRSESARV